MYRQDFIELMKKGKIAPTQVEQILFAKLDVLEIKLDVIISKLNEKFFSAGEKGPAVGSARQTEHESIEEFLKQAQTDGEKEKREYFSSQGEALNGLRHPDSKPSESQMREEQLQSWVQDTDEKIERLFSHLDGLNGQYCEAFNKVEELEKEQKRLTNRDSSVHQTLINLTNKYLNLESVLKELRNMFYNIHKEYIGVEGSAFLRYIDKFIIFYDQRLGGEKDGLQIGDKDGKSEIGRNALPSRKSIDSKPPEQSDDEHGIEGKYEVWTREELIEECYNLLRMIDVLESHQYQPEIEIVLSGDDVEWMIEGLKDYMADYDEDSQYLIEERKRLYQIEDKLRETKGDLGKLNIPHGYDYKIKPKGEELERLEKIDRETTISRTKGGEE